MLAREEPDPEVAALAWAEAWNLRGSWSDQSPALAIELLATCFTGERHDGLVRGLEGGQRSGVLAAPAAALALGVGLVGCLERHV